MVIKGIGLVVVGVVTGSMIAAFKDALSLKERIAASDIAIAAFPNDTIQIGVIATISPFHWSEEIEPVDGWNDQSQYYSPDDWQKRRKTSSNGGAQAALHNAMNDPRIIDFFLQLEKEHGFYDDNLGMIGDGKHSFHNGYYAYKLVADTTGFTFDFRDTINLQDAITIGNYGIPMITGVTGKAVNSDGKEVNVAGGHILVIKGGKFDDKDNVTQVYTVDTNPFTNSKGFTAAQWEHGNSDPFNGHFWDGWVLITVPKERGSDVDAFLHSQGLK